MRVALRWTGALVVALGVAAGCASSSGNKGSPGNDGGGQGGMCGGYADPCCDGNACDVGLMCSSGVCITPVPADATPDSMGDVGVMDAVSEVASDATSGLDANDANTIDAPLDSAGDVIVADAAVDATSTPDGGGASNGSPCTAKGQCASGVCSSGADMFCCSAACTGPCQSCASGSCTLITAGSQGACGTNLVCSAAGVCG